MKLPGKPAGRAFEDPRRRDAGQEPASGKWRLVPEEVLSLDRLGLFGDITLVNREHIRKHLAGRGPCVIRTSDGKEFPVPHPEFVMIGRHNVVIESAKRFLDILDPLHVVSIRPGGRR